MELMPLPHTLGLPRVLVIALSLLAAAPALALGAADDANNCHAGIGQSCTFHCHVNNNIQINVIGALNGLGIVGIGTGRASCANLEVTCTSPNGTSFNCQRWGTGHVTFDDTGTCSWDGIGLGEIWCGAS